MRGDQRAEPGQKFKIRAARVRQKRRALRRRLRGGSRKERFLP